MLRKQAYEIPERYAQHWLLLLVADRVDVAEHRVGEAIAKPAESLGLSGLSRYARSNPLKTAAGLAFGAWVAKRVLLGKR